MIKTFTAFTTFAKNCGRRSKWPQSIFRESTTWPCDGNKTRWPGRSEDGGPACSRKLIAHLYTTAVRAHQCRRWCRRNSGGHPL